MKTLLVLRHAKSSWKQPGLSDHDRPLNKRGRRDAPRMGELLREADLLPDRILASTARRARETALAVAEASVCDAEPELDPELYGADVETCLALLRRRGGEAERVLIVAHNPGLEELVEQLTDEAEPFPTAALAWIELPIARWSELDEEVAGRLRALWRPRELGGD